ncbi:4'-phosphopantetheinyl transferase superfamily protein [Oscillospiraceae bacterium PP1C4]
MMENIVYLMPTDTTELSAAAHALLEHVLGFPVRIARGAHGKPFLPEHSGLHFNLSHTSGAVVCALSGHPVGVDIERARPVRPALAARCFTQAEREYAVDEARFLEVWTRKEALLKRDGRGITVPLRELETTNHPAISTLVVDGFTLSFCGEPSAFKLVKMILI